MPHFLPPVPDASSEPLPRGGGVQVPGAVMEDTLREGRSDCCRTKLGSPQP